MARDGEFKEMVEKLRNLKTGPNTRTPTGRSPHMPILLLSTMILRVKDGLDLKDIPKDSEDKYYDLLDSTWQGLCDVIGEKKDNIYEPLFRLKSKADDEQIWKVELKDGVDPKSKPKRNLGEIVERISMSEDLIDYIDDDESRRKLMDALLDNKYVFSMDSDCQRFLEEGIISSSLKQKFEGQNIKLSDNAELIFKNKQWFVYHQKYLYRMEHVKEDDEIKVYDIAYFTDEQIEKLKRELKQYKGLYVDDKGDKYMHKSDFVEKEHKSNTSNHRRDMSNFFEYLHDKGFIFDKETVENFLLSLKVKPFVILTGTTGTGKTKLAQLYGQYLDRKNIDVESDKDKILTSVKVGKSHKNKGWTLSKEDFFEVFSDLERLEKGNKIRVDEIDGKGHIDLTPRLFLEKDSEEIIERLRFLANEDPNQRIKLEIQVDEDIILKGKSSNPGDCMYEIIPVGSDWTDNKNIVGFYNVITSEYQETPALDLIFRAIEQKDLPHMIILDEMNLSHVERYFSDFLSAIESGEQIPLHTKEGLMDVPTDLSVPDNIFIVGTVNIDETTYMFSPKVLDRANTIEFLTLPAIEYMSTELIYDPPTGDTEYLEDPLLDTHLRNTTIEDLREKFDDVKAEDGRPFWDVYSKEINRFQNTLKKANFDFGFRVINEITRFMYASWIYEQRPNTWDNWHRYFDAQIKQKMLPKVHGSQRELGNVLKDLFQLCYQGSFDNQVRNLKGLENDNNLIYRSSALKIHEMSKILYNQRYVSFTK